MMKLTTMWQVVATVNDQRRCRLAEKILRLWGYDPDSVRFFRASANFVFTFTQDGQRRFLRFNASSERTREAIESEVQLLSWLVSRGIPVAAPLRSLRGNLVETLITDLGTYHAVVFVGLEGSQPETDELSGADFRTWGASLGRLHAALKAYDNPSKSSRETWRDHLRLAEQFITRDQQELQLELNQVTAWADSLREGDDDFGLIHFDYETDNLCWQNGGIAALDFDDCAHYWFVADIAFALRDLFEDGVDLGNPMFKDFVAGYQECNSVNRGLLVQLPMFMRLHKLYLYGRLSRALDLTADQEAPPWLQRLNAKLRGKLDAYEHSLATHPGS